MERTGWSLKAGAWTATVGVGAALLAVAAAVAVGVRSGWLRWPGGPPTAHSVPVTAPPAGEVAAGLSAGETVLFEATDPAGDDRGPGSYRYPSDPGFLPGTFDLRRFRVSSDGQAVHFRLTFGAVPNPWGAPEGFGYQRVDLYLHTGAGKGRLTPLRPGANVRFTPGLGWDRLVRIAPWGGSRVERAAAETPANGAAAQEVAPVAVKAVREGVDTVHVVVPANVLGHPSRRWRYYVLVGGYDAFGPDEFRPVTAQGGRWVFGGGADGNSDPNLLDLLAPRFGSHAQHRQLRVTGEGGLAVVYPAGR